MMSDTGSTAKPTGSVASELKVVIAHRQMAARLELIQEQAGDAIRWACCDPDDEGSLLQELSDADIVITPRLTDAQAAAAEALRLVLTTGAGIDQIALRRDANVVIANTYNHGRSIAEYVVFCMIALRRGLIGADDALRRGAWRSAMYDTAISPVDTLRNCRLGVVGFGEIGRELCTLVAPFGVTVSAVKKRPTAAAVNGVAWLGQPGDLPRLLEESDFVVVAVPLDDSTINLISSNELCAMRPSAYLINVARGPVVNEDDLYEALSRRRIAGAALDVWWSYPGDVQQTKPASKPYELLDNVIMTPHISGLTNETMNRRARDIGANIRRFRDGEPLANLVRR